MLKLVRPIYSMFLCFVLCLYSHIPVEAQDSNDEPAETRIGQEQLFVIISVPSIQKELELTEKQIASIRKLNPMLVLVTFSKAIAPISNILTEKQLKEFKRIAFQGLMLRAFAVAEVRESLELTLDQKKAVAAIQSKLKLKMQPIQNKIKSSENVDQIALSRETSVILEDAYVEALGLLTAEQMKKWEEISRPVPLRNNRDNRTENR